MFLPLHSYHNSWKKTGLHRFHRLLGWQPVHRRLHRQQSRSFRRCPEFIFKKTHFWEPSQTTTSPDKLSPIHLFFGELEPTIPTFPSLYFTPRWVALLLHFQKASSSSKTHLPNLERPNQQVDVADWNDALLPPKWERSKMYHYLKKKWSQNPGSGLDISSSLHNYAT